MSQAPLHPEGTPRHEQILDLVVQDMLQKQARFCREAGSRAMRASVRRAPAKRLQPSLEPLKLASFPDPRTEGQGIVYLLFSSAHRAWKVGKASGVDPTARLLQVRANSTAADAEVVSFVRLPSERAALRLERLLHERFAESAYRRVKGDGGSEWFRAPGLPECFARLKARLG